jgi:hypothetical protein
VHSNFKKLRAFCKRSKTNHLKIAMKSSWRIGMPFWTGLCMLTREDPQVLSDVQADILLISRTW